MLPKLLLHTICCLFLVVALPNNSNSIEPSSHSIARQWNDELLEAIRRDFARPTVHARNLFHVSIAMWDAWAAYDPLAKNYLHTEKADAPDIASARAETLSYATYRILSARFSGSPGATIALASFDARMSELGYDPDDTGTDGESPSALGNRIASTVLAFGAADGSNEENDFANQHYEPVNPALFPALPGNPSIEDPNRWQPLVLEFFVDQAGIPFPLGVPEFLSPEWGRVTPFALTETDRTIRYDGDFEYWLYHDPGAPPYLIEGDEGDEAYRSGFEQVLEWSALLDPADGVMIDIGPGARGNNALGTNDGQGRPMNPKTGLPYPENIVPAGDYYRVLAEFWADGPDSETPPGHWFTIANTVSDHPDLVKRLEGEGPVVDDLEWDVKLYLALAGAVHDSAVAAWGAKGWYDYLRPISAIRYMASNGQSSDPDLPSYHPDGIRLVPGRVELLTPESIAPGERHAHLAGRFGVNVGKVAARAWRGPRFIDDPETSTAGVGWILVENWWPYQRPTFVTPPFAGYVSGHSTFSRAAAEVMTQFTGDAYFPGGVGEFLAPRDEFLVFEDGPSVDVNLQWATYRDASDETSLSRIYGGIHPTADDIPGRLMGAVIGPDAFDLAREHWGPWQALDLDQVTISGGTRLFSQGTMRVGERGEKDAFDPADGVKLRVTATGEVVVETGIAACQTQAKKRYATRCSDASGDFVAWFDDRTATTAWPFRLITRMPASASPVEGPIIVEISSGDARRAGVASRCVARGDRLVCRPASQAARPEPKPRASKTGLASPN